MFSRFMGQRNPEKDEERLLTSLGAAGVLGGGDVNPDWVPSLENWADSWMWGYGHELTLGENDSCGAWWLTNPAYSGIAITVYPYVAVVSSSDGNLVYTATFNWAAENTPGSYTDHVNTNLSSPWTTYAVSGAPGIYRLPGLLLGPGDVYSTYASGNHMLQCFFTRKGAETDTIDDTIYMLGWSIVYG